MWIIWITITSVALLCFGAAYAVYVARRPLPPGKTWIEVVIGDGITALGMSIILVLLTAHCQDAEWWIPALVALVPFWCLGLTGLPMIVGQIIKNHILEQTTIDLVTVLGENMTIAGIAKQYWRSNDDNSTEGVAAGVQAPEREADECD